VTQAPEQKEQPLEALFEVWREEKGTRHYFFGRDVDLRARHPAVAGAAAHEAAFEAREEGECEILETDRVTFTVSTQDPFPGDLEEVQIRCGDVVVASTRAEGPHEAPLVLEGATALEARAFQPFLDCAGLTTVGLCVRWADQEDLQAVERVAVRVVPSKITPRELEQLMTELDLVSSGILFDAYTKTYVGLRESGRIKRRLNARLSGIRTGIVHGRADCGHNREEQEPERKRNIAVLRRGEGIELVPQTLDKHLRCSVKSRHGQPSKSDLILD
jgi:hypothetical protein